MRLGILEERLSNLIESNLETHEELHSDMTSLRTQTHDWMQKVLDRLPSWAVAVMSLGATALGGMAMWIITHK